MNSRSVVGAWPVVVKRFTIAIDSLHGVVPHAAVFLSRTCLIGPCCVGTGASLMKIGLALCWFGAVALGLDRLGARKARRWNTFESA